VKKANYLTHLIVTLSITAMERSEMDCITKFCLVSSIIDLPPVVGRHYWIHYVGSVSSCYRQEFKKIFSCWHTAYSPGFGVIVFVHLRFCSHGNELLDLGNMTRLIDLAWLVILFDQVHYCWAYYNIIETSFLEVSFQHDIIIPCVYIAMNCYPYCLSFSLLFM